MEENGNCADRDVVLALHKIRADVEFADVVFQIARHAPVALTRSVGCQYDELKPVRLNGSLLQRADDFIIAARDG